MVKNKDIQVMLVCKNLKFFSKRDREMFISWLDRIDCIEKVSEEDGSFYVYLPTKKLHEMDLRNLLAIFYRYKIDMKQFRQFLNEENKKWFFNKKYPGYWYKRVFGS